jgi:sugar phosphate isomerase/epimerase
MRSLAIDVLSVFGLPPVEFVNLTADLGCDGLSVTTFFGDYNPHGYPAYSLVADKALRREMKAAMADRGVSITTAEGCFVLPGRDIRDFAADIEALHDLGVPRLTTISLDGDVPRSFDQFAVLAEMAANAGMEVALEFVPTITVPDLPTALAARHHVGKPNFKLVIDAMHWFRSGLKGEDAAALDPATISYFQLCDAPMKPVIANYGEEAALERSAPGKGELPLRSLLANLPRDVVLSVEIPQRSLADKGIGPYERLKPCVAGARALMAEVGLT